MNHISDVRELNTFEIEAVSGGCDSHEQSGKELADAIQEATHRVLEWIRNI